MEAHTKTHYEQGETGNKTNYSGKGKRQTNGNWATQTLGRDGFERSDLEQCINKATLFSGAKDSCSMNESVTL